MKHRPFCFFLFALLILSCSGRVADRQLDFAEQYIMSNPKASLEAIEKISAKSLTTKSKLARYSLLHTMAIDRNAIDTTDFSLISPALDYYLLHGNSKQRTYSCYYGGCICSNSGDYLSAIIYYHEALEYSSELNDPWIKGMINSRLAITYNNNYLKQDELHYAQKAYDSFTAYGDSVFIDNAKAILATAYHNNRLFNESDSIALSINSSSRYYSSALWTLASNAVFKEDMNAQATVQLFEVAKKSGAYFFPYDWYKYAYALTAAGNKSQSEELLDKLESLPKTANTIWWEYKIALLNNDLSQALTYLERYNEMVESSASTLLSQSLYKVEKEHYRLTSQNNSLRAKSYRNATITLSIALALLILASIAVFLYLKDRYLYKLQLLESRFSEAQHMLELAHKDELADIDSYNKNQLLDIRKAYAQLYHKQFSEIGYLYDSVKDEKMIDKGYLRYATRVSAILDEISSDKVKHAQFLSRLNNDLDGIINRLQEDFPSFDDDTIRFLSYVIAGFEPTAIATITSSNPSSVRSRKSRLKKQILSKDTPNHALYEAYIA